MVYSAPKEPTKPKRSRQPGARLVETRAIVSFDDRRYVLEGPVAVLGRSRESDCVFRDPNISRRHAARRGPTGDWQVVDLGSTNGVKVNGRRVEALACRPATRSPSGPRGSSSTSSSERMESDPVAVALKFGFLAVLYLFLFWVARSALRELRGTGGPAPEPTGFHSLPGARRGEAPTDGWSRWRVAGSTREQFDLFGGLSIGRSSDADVRIEDRFASGIHVRIYPRGGAYYVEDMGSTGRTYLTAISSKATSSSTTSTGSGSAAPSSGSNWRAKG